MSKFKNLVHLRNLPKTFSQIVGLIWSRTHRNWFFSLVVQYRLLAQTFDFTHLHKKKSHGVKTQDLDGELISDRLEFKRFRNFHASRSCSTVVWHVTPSRWNHWPSRSIFWNWHRKNCYSIFPNPTPAVCYLYTCLTINSHKHCYI